ncbi:hypothetical protein HPE56_07635 [Maribacter sp. ANRC-HE7]|uniref:Sperm nuclear basic protein PL-I n=1 Tax=Maribacter aquimaris TaxID=2737171 RepID=A0ABR7UYH6_9FLAO|nr:hypothetical protein [Maribacter aquimaris]MBD0777660.1 hypothetical protein [Maribacter aquimaris]
MRNIVLLLTALVFSTSGTMASTVEDKVATSNAYTNNNSFIFIEQGITFSVFPDGEFDFYIENYVSGRNNGVTMNSGYDYSPYAQYDDYGAVVQVENVPIYYDNYGRVTQIGDVNINYRNNRVFRMGGMYVYYNHNGFYDHHTGYINVYNRHYVYRPFHRFFLRPAIGFSLVYQRPYRRYYAPYRYTYYRPYNYNTRRAYAKIGREHRYNQVRRERATIYRNDKRVAQRRVNHTRRNDVARTNRTVNRNNVINKNYRSNTQRAKVSKNVGTRSNRSNAKVANRSTVNRLKSVNTKSLNNRSVAQRSTSVRTPQRNTITKKTVTKTPRRTTVTRSSTTYKKPVSRTTNRNVRSSIATRTQRSVAQRPSSRSTSKSTVRKAASKSRSVATRSSSSRSSKGRSSSRQ